MKAGMYKEAEAQLTRSLHAYEHNFETHIRRAICRLFQGKPDTVYGEDLKRYKRIKPER